VFEGKEAIGNDFVGTMPLEMDNEAHTATVVLVLRAVESLRGRQMRMPHSLRPRFLCELCPEFRNEHSPCGVFADIAVDCENIRKPERKVR
jgi:hypothetical protein